MRQSRDSTLSGEPLSEEGKSEAPDSVKLTDKEKAEIEKQKQRQVVIAAKMTSERTEAR